MLRVVERTVLAVGACLLAALLVSACAKKEGGASPATASLMVEVSPAGAGSVAVVPNPDQGSRYRMGTNVVVEAKPKAGFEFSAWAGAAGGTANPTNLALTGDLSLIAVFRPSAQPYQPSAASAGAVKAPAPDDRAQSYQPPGAATPGQAKAPALDNRAQSFVPPVRPGEALDVVVNGRPLIREARLRLEQQYGFRIQPGRYWYDGESGAFGLEGGPTAGFILPDLDMGGELRADASGGGTDVFLNGRELHPLDLLQLQTLLGPVPPARYWLNGQGFFGFEGSPTVGNLVLLAQAASSGGGGFTRNYGSGSVSSDGQVTSFYDRSSGCSIISGEGIQC